MKEPLQSLWVLVDKRGDILERDKLRPTSLEEGAGLPLETFWGNRESAYHQRKKIKECMTKGGWQGGWDYWKFRVVQYKMVKRERQYGINRV